MTKIAFGSLFILAPLLTCAATTIRVGVDQSPPLYSILPDGSVEGLAVDVLNEAARRRGIKLVWIPLHDVPLDTALQNRIVQLWPLVGSTAERRAKFYMSAPWLISDYVLISLKEHPIRNAHDAVGLFIAHARLKFTQLIADRQFPRSKQIISVFREQAIQAVCRGEAAAALLESRVVDAMLLKRPQGCETSYFHIAFLSGTNSPLSIAAVPEVRDAASTLRDEISILTENGFLSGKLDEWSPSSAQGTRSIWAQEEANNRNRIYRLALIVILGLAAGLAWLAWHAWKLKVAAESADARRREAQRRFTAFMDNSPALAFMKDARGKMLYVNKAFSQLLKMTPQHCIGKDDFTLWPADVASTLRTTDLAMLQEDRPVQTIERIPVSAFDVRDFLVVKFPFANADGEKFIGGTAIDISDRESALRALGSSETRYRELFEHNPVPAWVYDRQSLAFLNVNVAAINRYGWTREDFLGGLTFSDVVAIGSGAPRHKTRDGLLLTVDATSYEMEYEGRQACLMIVRDLTELEGTLHQLRLSEERWQLALQGAGDGLWDWDIALDRIFRSPRWRGMLGYAESEIGNTHAAFLELLHSDDLVPTLAAVNAHLDKKTALFSAEYRMRHKDGTWRWIMDRGQAIWDERGCPVRMAGAHTDITTRKQAEDILNLQARTDALTGLPNRWEFDKLFGTTWAEARQNGTALTVCVCDLDQFKNVNDRHGHAAGDRVLITFGEILRQHLRKSDILARLGGDEFIVAMPETSPEEALIVMERMRRQLRTHVFAGTGASFHITGSVGVAPLRATHQSGDELIAEADRFLYEAKEAGRNGTLVAA